MKMLLLLVGILVGSTASRASIIYKVVPVTLLDESLLYVHATCIRENGRKDRPLTLTLFSPPMIAGIGEFKEYTLRVMKDAVTASELKAAYWNRKDTIRNERLEAKRERVTLRPEEVSRAFVAVRFSEVKRTDCDVLVYCIPVAMIEEALSKAAPAVRPLSL